MIRATVPSPARGGAARAVPRSDNDIRADALACSIVTRARVIANESLQMLRELESLSNIAGTMLDQDRLAVRSLQEFAAGFAYRAEGVLLRERGTVAMQPVMEPKA